MTSLSWGGRAIQLNLTLMDGFKLLVKYMSHGCMTWDKLLVTMTMLSLNSSTMRHGGSTPDLNIQMEECLNGLWRDLKLLDATMSLQERHLNSILLEATEFSQEAINALAACQAGTWETGLTAILLQA